MRSAQKVRKARPGIVVVAIASAVAAATYAGPPGSGANGVDAAERHEAEREIARSRIVTKLEAALGERFGGLWFDPSTAKLHVGVPSAASRRSAEMAAERAAVGEIVVATPVRSTWAELEAAQRRWGEILGDLFEREEVATSLLPQRNALGVELGSSVPAAVRTELEAIAARDSVAVSIEVAPDPYFRIGRDAQCKAFKANEAYCDPTIVSGVTIQHEAEVERPCTAGPVVLPKDGSTPAKATERLLLTAGHCIDKEGEGKWFAYNQKGVKLEVGTAGAFVNSHEADIGVIPIRNDPKLWTQAGLIPVVPTISYWGKHEGESTEPFPVVSSTEPIVGLESCMSGQTSGESCGKVLQINQTLAGVEGVTEVDAKRAPGDSGAPWYSRSYATSGSGLVEGVHIGFNSSNGNKAVFQPLKPGLEVLKAKKGLDVELLTQSNEERKHPPVKAESSPATLTGSQQTGNSFAFNAGSVHCTGVTYLGELAKTELEEIVLAPSYSGCQLTTVFSETLEATIDVNGCSYRLTATGEVHLQCPGASVVRVTAPLCNITMSPQTAGAVDLVGVGSGTTREIDAVWGLSGVDYVQTTFCPGGGGTFANGSYGGVARLTGENSEGSHVGIWVG
jgi:hypothetical protein